MKYNRTCEPPRKRDMRGRKYAQHDNPLECCSYKIRPSLSDSNSSRDLRILLKIYHRVHLQFQSVLLGTEIERQLLQANQPLVSVSLRPPVLRRRAPVDKRCVPAWTVRGERTPEMDVSLSIIHFTLLFQTGGFWLRTPCTAVSVLAQCPVCPPCSSGSHPCNY